MTGLAVFANEEARILLLQAKVLIPETLCLNPLWLSHMSDQLESSFGDDNTSNVVVQLKRVRYACAGAAIRLALT